MRGSIPQLLPAHPISQFLPSCYVEHDFVRRFCAGLDGLIAPISTTLDCLPGYFDPQLAPPDFLAWLASWVGLDQDENWTDRQKRDLISQAISAHQIRGTKVGLTTYLTILTGGTVEISDCGDTSWAQRTRPLPMDLTPPGVQVRVNLPFGLRINQRWLHAVVREAVPVHLPVTLLVTTATAGTGSTAVPGFNTESTSDADMPGVRDP